MLNYQRLQDQFISYLPPLFHIIWKRFNSLRLSTDEMSCYIKIVNNSRKSEIKFVLARALEFLFVDYPE